MSQEGQFDPSETRKSSHDGVLLRYTSMKVIGTAILAVPGFAGLLDHEPDDRERRHGQVISRLNAAPRQTEAL